METPIEILKSELRQMNAVISLRRHSKKREYIKLVPLFEEAIRVLESQQNTKTELHSNCNIPVVSNSLPVHWCTWCEIETGVKDGKCIYCSKPIGQ